MTDIAPWSFYGRRSELQQMQRILERRRWFFLQISGRRRIGKTALIQEAVRDAGIDKTLYIQIPDSDPAGVVAACNGYLETFGIDARVSRLGELAQLIGRPASTGYVVALDEFQYFHRKQLADFCSLLQAEVDRLAARAAEVVGVEGHALEDLAGQLYAKRSRLGIGDFALSERIRGDWDRSDVERGEVGQKSRPRSAARLARQGRAGQERRMSVWEGVKCIQLRNGRAAS